MLVILADKRPRLRTAATAILITLAACSPAPSPIPSLVREPPSASASASESPNQSPTPGSFADTIRISMPAALLPGFLKGPPTGVGPISNANSFAPRPYADPGSLLRLVSDGIYGLDDHLVPVPDLAARPCDVSADGLTFTCRLVETTFHDGSALTADDVAFTYGLALTRACSFQICFENPPHPPDIQRHLGSVDVVDATGDTVLRRGHGRHPQAVVPDKTATWCAVPCRRGTGTPPRRGRRRSER